MPSDIVYLSTKNLALPKGWAQKLLPKFIGPYKVLKADNDIPTVTLELPPELQTWHVHPTFHESLIKAHIPNNDGQFPCHDMKSYYNFGSANKAEWFIDKILAH